MVNLSIRLFYSKIVNNGGINMTFIADKMKFIDAYVHAQNAATGSSVDANANVTRKTVSTLESEIFKPEFIKINRYRMNQKLKELFPTTNLDQQYIKDIDSHLIYIHDETSLKPYCASITLYPFLFYGTKCLGGCSKAPKNLQSFCGSFVNLVYQVASNFAGAIATVEFLSYFDYFARKSYGPNYLKTNYKEVIQEFQGVVYALNQPASARGDQSVFWNISVFDQGYLHGMFEDFRFPDGSSIDEVSVRQLQFAFLDWFRLERKKELLTFPVVTACLLVDYKKQSFLDEELMHYCAEQNSLGHSFFVYMSDNVDSLASCCRLRNELADNTFSYTLGAGGVVTGSSQVITLNYNRFIQKCSDSLEAVVDRIHHYLLAHKMVYKDMIDNGLLPAYEAGFMDLDKQFMTIGINGVVEGCQFLGLEISDNPNYQHHIESLLSKISHLNKQARITYKEYNPIFNTEFVPAENLGVKNAKWDKKDGLKVPRNCYNSYFYEVENENFLEKITLHGDKYTGNLDGGSALHLNLEQLPNKDTFEKIYYLTLKNKVPYWTTNTKSTVCNDCDYINPRTENRCVKCGSTNIDYATRVIGYLKRVSNFSEARQAEHARRGYVKTE